MRRGLLCQQHIESVAHCGAASGRLGSVACLSDVVWEQEVFTSDYSNCCRLPAGVTCMHACMYLSAAAAVMCSAAWLGCFDNLTGQVDGSAVGRKARTARGSADGGPLWHTAVCHA